MNLPPGTEPFSAEVFADFRLALMTEDQPKMDALMAEHITTIYRAIQLVATLAGEIAFLMTRHIPRQDRGHLGFAISENASPALRTAMQLVTCSANEDMGTLSDLMAVLFRNDPAENPGEDVIAALAQLLKTLLIARAHEQARLS